MTAPLSAQTFTHGMRQLTLPVAVITVHSGGQRNGLTASSFCSVSTQPPRVLVCIGKQSSTHSQLAVGEGIGVNVLAADQQDIAMGFASKSVHGEQRFEQGCWRPLITGAPMLEGSAVSFDCVIDSIIDDTTHSIVTATVVGMTHSDQPCLLYHNGAAVAMPTAQPA
ncbi:flavin reductase [Shimwellia pseudoproteus]|uniref:flavin reductase family protein n=1 Tax=Shimwellia pseudoproteus TaxID=570012 RepID=UPI0018EDA611|nr:flavin reductase family protein [Shimwellia pseudoproteus]MBJ3814587.1 flavin reductase [Shimwellia pseudoproteus]